MPQHKNQPKTEPENVIITPPALTQRMCDRVEPAISDFSRKVFEPGCGDGAFLVETLRRRLARTKTPMDALLSLANLYGVDILPASIKNARQNLRHLLKTSYPPSRADYRFWPLAELFLAKNLIAADLLKSPNELIFIDWQPISPYNFSAQPCSLAELLSIASPRGNHA